VSLFAAAAEEDRQPGWSDDFPLQLPNFIKGALQHLDNVLRDEQQHEQRDDARVLWQRDSGVADQGLGELAGDMPSDDDSAVVELFNRCGALQLGCSSGHHATVGGQVPPLCAIRAATQLSDLLVLLAAC